MLAETVDGVSEAPALDVDPLHCWDCNVSFTTRRYLHDHLLHHIKQPRVVLERVKVPPLKITIKATDSNNFEIVQSPNGNVAETETAGRREPEGDEAATESTEGQSEGTDGVAERDEEVAEKNESDGSFCLEYELSEGEGEKGDVVPGGEPTPPPETELPKIRIKTTGLLKDVAVVGDETGAG